jgi:radical SAM superfamily enzyme YgiQ (UPF0313 family)
VKILFTHGYFLHEDARERQIMKPYPPLGILYLSAWLEQNGYPNEVFDSTFSDFDALCQLLQQDPPDVIAVYTNLMTKLNVLRLIRFVRAAPELRRTRMVLGGPEVRNHAENFLQHGADIIVVGEGEETMLAIVRTLEHSDPDTSNARLIEGIEGCIALDEKGGMVQNPERPLLRQLDELPVPARHKIRLEDYLEAWKMRHGYSAFSVSTMRGCPYTCKWCSRAVYGQTYRRRSPAHVVAELRELRSRYDFDTVWFVDDVFTISHRWLSEFRDETLRAGLSIKYECITRADRMNEEVIRLLKESGCFLVWIGAESGSQRVIDAMDRRVDVQQVRAMIRAARAAGLEAGTFLMLGYPGETEADIEETIRHLKESRPDHYTITLAYPIKGTPLYTETRETFVHAPDWATSTDRDIDFRRRYPRPYYNFAIKRMHNEYAFARAMESGRQQLASALVFKMKSLIAKGGMWLHRR